MKTLRRLLATSLLITPVFIAPLSRAASESYATEGECDGHPRVQLAVKSPMCVGLVAQHLGYVRGVTAVGQDVYVIDMGGWGGRRGRLLRLPDGGRGAPQVLMQGLRQPNAVVPGPGNTLLVGVTGALLRVDPHVADPAASARVVVRDLPTTGLHPVPSIALAPDGTIFLAVGSETNNCERTGGARPDPDKPCPETLESPPRGAILRVPPGTLDRSAKDLQVEARGLRNAMAMTVLPDGKLVAAVNARDAIEGVAPKLDGKALPHDPVYVVEPGADHGWPRCYDDGVASPEYPKADCSKLPHPALLLPAHAAPLGLLRVRGGRLPGLYDHLLVALHGYRASGHKLVAIALDQDRRPTGEPVEIVGDWGPAPGRHPQGAPVSLWEMDDGSVLISEDHNGTLLRLSAPPADR